MATYIIIAFAVALFALLTGFTGGISSPMLSNPRSGSHEGEDAHTNVAAEASSGGYSAERKLPSEILDAVAEAERLDARPQVVGQLLSRQSLGFDAQPSTSRPADLGRLVLVGGRRRMLAEIVDGLVDGAQFMTLTGPPGVGKTIMAATIRKELNERSVSVRWVDGGGGSGIRLRTIMSQILGKPETDIDDGDIEQLFDAMTEREELIQRMVLIIDDAERLLPEAIGYLRLLASIAMERMPQIVFVGGPSFWEIARQAAQVGFEDLIAARFELEPLNPLETHAVTQQLLSTLSPARKPAFDMDALEAVVQRTDGLIGRLVPLVTAIEAIASETGQTRVTAAVIDTAAVRLEGGLDSLASRPAVSTPENGSAEAIEAAGALVPIPITPARNGVPRECRGLQRRWSEVLAWQHTGWPRLVSIGYRQKREPLWRTGTAGGAYLPIRR